MTRKLLRVATFVSALAGCTSPTSEPPTGAEDAGDEQPVEMRDAAARGGGGGREGAGGGGSGGSGEPRGGASGGGGGEDAGARADARGPDDAGASGDGRTDGGAPVDAAGPRPDAAAGKGTPTFVAVGYAGRRIRSRDLGLTWENDQNLGGGGDDQFLLRAVAYGNGVFVATGWKILTSVDGATWTERKNPHSQWLGGVQFGNDRFAAVGGYGASAFSLDGITWKAGASRSAEAARSLAFGAGKFIGATDPGTWWASTDGEKWARESSGHSSRVVYCTDAFKDAKSCPGAIGRNDGRTAFGAGVWVGVRGSTIERSEDGVTWKTVKTGGPSFEAVGFGYAE